MAQTDLSDLSKPVRNVNFGTEKQWPALNFWLILLHCQRPQNHSKLKEIRFDADIKGETLICIDKRPSLGRFPPHRTAAAVNVDNLGILLVIKYNIGKRQVPLYEARFVKIGKALNDLTSPSFPLSPGDAEISRLAIVVNSVHESSFGAVVKKQSFDNLTIVVGYEPSETNYMVGISQAVEGVDFVEKLFDYFGSWNFFLYHDLIANADFVDKAGHVSIKVNIALLDHQTVEMLQCFNTRIVNFFLRELAKDLLFT